MKSLIESAAIVITSSIIIALSLGFFIGRVSAAPAPKYWVCKYVGQPSVDEHLQTGQNPISISENAIQNFNGVGSYFNDQHGRSFVLVEDTGQDEPDVSECPAPDTPPYVPPTDPPLNVDNRTPDVQVPSQAGENKPGGKE